MEYWLFRSGTGILPPMKQIFPIVLALTWALTAQAQLLIQDIEYKHDGTLLQGHLAYDLLVKGPRPGVLIVHQWKGLGDYEKKRAAQLARLGYNVFAVDKLVSYGGAVHSFTDSGAGQDNSKGAAYNEKADRRSWEAMKQFFGEIFK